MNTVPDTPDTADEALNRLLCEDIAPIPLRDVRRQGGLGGLLARVGRSIADHAGLLTVRSREDRWVKVMAGVRKKVLWDGPEGSSLLLELAPGVRLPVHRHAGLEESICLAGGLLLGDLELGPGDYHAALPGSRHGHITSCARRGAVAFLRGAALGHTVKVIGELIGGLLPGEGAPLHTVLRRDGGWQPLAAGVDSLPLLAADGRESRFLRLQPGGVLAAHHHTADEETMMLEGDAFFGDLLLQAGDFHRAPAGSRHGPVVSERGALMFVRGAAEGV